MEPEPERKPRQIDRVMYAKMVNFRMYDYQSLPRFQNCSTCGYAENPDEIDVFQCGLYELIKTTARNVCDRYESK